MHSLKLGALTALQGCTGGIENTNFFVTTQQDGRACNYVLTLFERLTQDQLPFYLRLMKHLAQHGIPVPNPHANVRGDLVFEFKGKPAAVVDRLPGNSELRPGAVHCAQLGDLLARLHLAGRDFELSQPNLRGLAWWNDTVPAVLPYLNPEQATLILAELAFQHHVAASGSYAALPRGPVHADLFRDNVLFDSGAGEPRLSAVIDFYFAGVDAWVYDLAVCLNDWCIDPVALTHQASLAHHLIGSYNAVRPLQAAERELLPAMLRAGALRFWLTRLWDFYLPREATVLTAHDPGHFERVLRLRSTEPLDYQALGGSV